MAELGPNLNFQSPSYSWLLTTLYPPSWHSRNHVFQTFQENPNFNYFVLVSSWLSTFLSAQMSYFCLQKHDPWNHMPDGHCRPKSWPPEPAAHNEWSWPAVKGQLWLTPQAVVDQEREGLMFLFRSSKFLKCWTPDFQRKYLVVFNVYNSFDLKKVWVCPDTRPKKYKCPFACQVISTLP